VLILSFVGGYLDAAFFLALFGLFVGLQTGNIIVVASYVELGGPVISHAIVIAPWVVGVVAGAAACAALARADFGRRASLALMLPLCAAIIGAALGAGVSQASALAASGAAVDSSGVYIVGCVAAFAYGFYLAVLRGLLPTLPFTNMQTGNLMSLIDDATHAVIDAAAGGGAGAAAAGKRRERLEFSTAAVVGFICGAFAGAWLQSVGGFAALALPMALLCVLAADALAARVQWGEGGATKGAAAAAAAAGGAKPPEV
jgi:uncharacterized membrane protein YoaK (UPF0700 family)